ncbi:MAG: hypothetical protein ABSH41_02855 [Syntrophobacteraceae bacterium]|jgi:hypothetical protein
MKMNGVIFSILLFVTISGPLHMAANAETGGISPSDIAGAPDKFCTVKKEPDPALLGGWKGVHQNYISKLSEHRAEPVGYYLKKVGNRYALYFYRKKQETDLTVTVYHGWRDWEIDGDQIVSSTGVKIFTKDGAVYYSWQNSNKPTRLSRDEKLGEP